jgi:hypothetical protein
MTRRLLIPNGGEGNVTVVHQDSPDKYTVVATVDTFAGAKTITVDPKTHNVYLFQPERGPAGRWRGATGWTRRTRSRSTGSDCRCVVYRYQAIEVEVANSPPNLRHQHT